MSKSVTLTSHLTTSPVSTCPQYSVASVSARWCEVVVVASFYVRSSCYRVRLYVTVITNTDHSFVYREMLGGVVMVMYGLDNKVNHIIIAVVGWVKSKFLLPWPSGLGPCNTSRSVRT